MARLKQKPDKVFIGVAWPYVNGNLHIGHLAGYLLPADISARFHKLMGRKVLMVSGSDCFGTPITIEADKRHVSPKVIVDEYHTKDIDLLTNILGLSYDLYTKTDHPNHILVVQDIFLKLLEKDYIFANTSEQYYSTSEEKFLPDRYVIGVCGFCGFKDSRSDQCDNCGKLLSQNDLIDPHSSLSNEPVILKETEHYFLDWAKIQPELEKYVKTSSPNWKDWVAMETKGWLKEGLRPRAITRDMDWGVPLPKDQIPAEKLIKQIGNKRLYVWFDAVIGYLSASILWAEENKKKWEDFWYGDNVKHYYFMGKDNLIFHTLFWPGKLMIYDDKLHIPDVVSINMFLNLEGKQFSKSRGVVIDTKKIVEDFGNDAVRFYLTLIMPETKDSSFSWSDFEVKNNSILVANLGNFIHRTLSIAYSADADIKQISTLKIDKEVQKHIKETFKLSIQHLENCEFRFYLDDIVKLSAFGNKFFDDKKVWELKKTDTQGFYDALNQLLHIIVNLGYLMQPLVPEASSRLLEALNLDQSIETTTAVWKKKSASISPTTDLKKQPMLLFKKIDLQDH